MNLARIVMITSSPLTKLIKSSTLLYAAWYIFQLKGPCTLHLTRPLTCDTHISWPFDLNTHHWPVTHAIWPLHSPFDLGQRQTLDLTLECDLAVLRDQGVRHLPGLDGRTSGRCKNTTPSQRKNSPAKENQSQKPSQNCNVIMLYLQCRLLTVIQSDMIEYFAVTWENLRNMWYMYVRQNISNSKKYLLG